MASRTTIDPAKQTLLQKAARKPWCVGVGIEKRDAALGLVLSVHPGTKAAAERFVNGLNLDVPVRVRELGPVRARKPASLNTPSKVPQRSVLQLRRAAKRRSSQ